MIKIKEILFLQNLKGVGKGRIYSKYWNVLNESEDFYDLASEMEIKYNFTPDEIKKAMDDAEKSYDELISSEIYAITVFDEKYPEKLRIMGNKKPLMLYVKGNMDALTKPNLSVIGTRKPSKPSQAFEQKMVKNTVNSTQRVIVSGLALGCDKIAHKATVDEGKITVAVLPSGVNVITPASHKKLAEDILSNGGCLISEYRPDAKASRGSYVERDAIVAALSDALFVVECGVKSGTMHTVNFASDYQRQIYTYLPSQRPEGSYDGNEYILNEINNSIAVEDIGEFIEDLNSINIKKPSKNNETTLFDF